MSLVCYSEEIEELELVGTSALHGSVHPEHNGHSGAGHGSSKVTWGGEPSQGAALLPGGPTSNGFTDGGLAR